MPPPPPEPEPESGGDPAVSVEECLRLLEAVPAAAASSPAFRRHWPSISASLAALSAALSSPAFPPAAPLLAPLAAALAALLSAAADAPRLGHLHTVSLLSSSAASLSQLAADARLLAAPPPPHSSSAAAAACAGGGADSGGADALISRLRLGSAASRAAALEELAATAASLPASAAALAVPAVAALLDSAGSGGDPLLPSTRERAVAVLAAFASSDAARRFLAEESGAVVPHLCRALESGAGAGAAEHACAALLPLTASSRDAAAAVAARGGVAALLAACAGGTPATQAAAAGVLRNLASFPDLLPWFRDEPGAVPLLLQLVSLGTPRAQELALGCLQNLTAGDGGDGDDGHQRLKVEAFQEGALACVKDYLDGAARGGGDEPAGLAPALGLLRNMASFRYIAEIAVSAGGFAEHAAAALGSDRLPTRTEAALALAELCGNSAGAAGGGGGGKAARREVEEEAVPRLVWMLEAKAAAERGAAARALAALMASSAACRKLFRKDERGVAGAVRMLDPAAGGTGGDGRRFAVAVLLAVAHSRRCRKQMVAAGACGFVQGLVAEEVEGAKKLAECLSKGKMLGVFPRT